MKPNLQVVLHQFKELMKKQQEADELLIDLLSHPEVCEVKDQIWEVCAMKSRAREALCGLIPKLRKSYPPTLKLLSLPWNAKEYDKYDRQVQNDA